MPRPFRRFPVLAAAVVLTSTAAAQQPPSLFVGAGAGGTYYCIITRCDTGTLLVGTVGYAPTPVLGISGSVRWHDCFDCSRFLIADAAVQLRYPGRTVAPFVGAGVGLSSDPDFMGDQFGLHAAVGTWVWFARQWGVQLEVRGRQVGRGDHMGEASLGVIYRLRAGP